MEDDLSHTTKRWLNFSIILEETVAMEDLLTFPSFHSTLWTSLCAEYWLSKRIKMHICSLAHNWPRDLHEYAFSTVSLIAQLLCKIREDAKQVLMVVLLVQPDLVLWGHAVRISPLLVNPGEGPFFLEAGYSLAPVPRPLEPLRLVPVRNKEEFRGLSPAMIGTITNHSDQILLCQVSRVSCLVLWEKPWRCGIESWCFPSSRTA